MTNTTKIAVGVGIAGAVIAAWLLFMNGGEKADSGSAPDAVQSPRLDVSPLKLEDQSPVVVPTPMKETTRAVESPPYETPKVKSAEPPVELLSWGRHACGDRASCRHRIRRADSDTAETEGNGRSCQRRV